MAEPTVIVEGIETGDIPMSEVLAGEPVHLPPTLSETFAARDAEKLRREKINNADWQDKTAAWFENFAQNNIVADTINDVYYGEYKNFKKDPNYKMDDKTALYLLQSNNLSQKFFRPLKATGSMEELNFKLDLMKKQRDRELWVRDTIGETGIMTSALAGNISDDVLMGMTTGYAGAGLKALGMVGSATRAAVTADVVGEIALATARYRTNRDYTFNDAMLDITIGSVTSSLVAWKSSKAFNTMQDNADSVYKTADDVDYTKPKPDVEPEARATTKAGDAVKPKGEVEVPVKPKVDPSIKHIVDISGSESFKKVRKLVDSLGYKKLKLKSTLQEMNKAINNLNKSKKESTRLKYRKQIEELSNTPQFRMAAITSQLLDDASFMKSVSDDIADIGTGLSKTDKNALMKAIKGEIPKEDLEEFKRLLTGKGVREEKLSAAARAKLPMLVAAMAVIPASAEAAEMSDEEMLFKWGIPILIAGVAGYKYLKHTNTSTMDVIRSIGRKFEGGFNNAAKMNTPETNKVRQFANKAADVIDTELTNAKAIFKGQDEAQEILSTIMGKDSIDMNFRVMYESSMGEISRSFKGTFNDFRKRFNDVTADQFNKMASDLIDNPKAVGGMYDDPALKAYVENYHSVMERLYNSAKEYGVKGFKDIEYDRTTMPRLWKTSDVQTMLSKLDAADAEAVYDNIYRAFGRSIEEYKVMVPDSFKKFATVQEAAKFYTDKFWNMWTNTELKRFMSSRDFRDIDKLQKFMLDKKIVGTVEEAEAMLEALIPQSDISARAKKRVIFNPNYIEDMELTIDGQKAKIGKSFFIERDLMTIADMTSKELSISNALASKGFATKSALWDAMVATTDGTQKQIDQMQDLFNVVIGQPTTSNSDLVESFILASRVTASVVKLPLVAFSTIPEFMNVMTRSNLASGMSSLMKSMFKAYPKNGEVMKLRKITGLASFNDRLYRKGYIGYEEINDLVNPNKNLTGFVKTLEDYTYTINRLGWLTDVTQLAGIEANMKVLRKFAKEGAGIPKSRILDYGIDDSFMKTFGDELRSGKPLDIDSWDVKKQDKFAAVLRAMNQTISPESMLHTKGLWMQTNTLGRIVSPLLNYSATVFNEQGLPLLRNVDRHSIFANINAVIGTYIGLTLRYELQGKEYDENDVLVYAITGSPLTGAYGVAKGMLAPATLDATSEVFNVLVPEQLETK